MQGAGRDALAFANQTEKQMLGAHIGLLQLACFLLCEDKNAAGLISEFLKHTRKASSKRERWSSQYRHAAKNSDDKTMTATQHASDMRAASLEMTGCLEQPF